MSISTGQFTQLSKSPGQLRWPLLFPPSGVMAQLTKDNRKRYMKKHLLRKKIKQNTTKTTELIKEELVKFKIDFTPEDMTKMQTTEHYILHLLKIILRHVTSTEISFQNELRNSGDSSLHLSSSSFSQQPGLKPAGILTTRNLKHLPSLRTLAQEIIQLILISYKVSKQTGKRITLGDLHAISGIMWASLYHIKYQNLFYGSLSFWSTILPKD